MRTFIPPLLVAAAVVLGLSMLIGCTEPPKQPGPYSTANMGPWQEVMPDPPSYSFKGMRMTIKVNYKSGMGDFVDRIYVQNERGERIGEVAFLPTSEVKVGFELPRGTAEVSVVVSSTQRGLWRSDPIKVPGASPLPPPAVP